MIDPGAARPGSDALARLEKQRVDRGAMGATSQASSAPAAPGQPSTSSTPARADRGACPAPAAGRPASASSHSSSCSCRMTPNTANIGSAVVRVRAANCVRRNVTWATFCPAPKQSYTAQPGKPRGPQLARGWRSESRRREVRTRHPGGLSIAKSAEAANAGATQQRPKQRSQSARSSRSGFGDIRALGELPGCGRTSSSCKGRRSMTGYAIGVAWGFWRLYFASVWPSA